ncbi:MAG: 2-amino-4-hydroxy-6-hydroxymethyldihydropteridine diphosphokinase [Pseudomonadota bacterium]
MTQAFIGLGANLGDPPAQLHEALKFLSRHPRIRLKQQSSFYRSAPLGPPGQAHYCNAVVAIEATLSPQDLLKALLDIERAMGRERSGQRWQSRLIDLDLLLYGDARVDLAGLQVPHPEMHKRNFVLVPLAEIAPDIQIPGLGTAGELAARIGRDELQLL